MKVLILSPRPELILDPIIRAGDTFWTRAPDLEVSDWPQSDWVISFGYRKIIPLDVIKRYEGRIINIHISLLPWNRGADPNFWSWFDRTPKGVTIHRVDAGIDTGEILANHALGDFDFREPTGMATLASTYSDLVITAAGLFNRSWELIRAGKPAEIVKVGGPGSYHRSGETEKFIWLPGGDKAATVYEIINLGKLYAGEQ